MLILAVILLIILFFLMIIIRRLLKRIEQLKIKSELLTQIIIFGDAKNEKIDKLQKFK